MSLLNELLQIDRERVRREKVVLHTIWDRLTNRVKLSMKARSQACIFTIPDIIPGYPLTNVPKTMNYLLKKLKKEGIMGVQIDPNNIYIAWDPQAIRELDKKQRKQQQTNELTTVETDFIDLLVEEKSKRK